MNEPLPSSAKKYFLTTTEVAHLFDVSVKTVCRWIDSKVIPSYRLPGKRRTRRVLIKALIQFCNENPQYKFVIERFLRERAHERQAIAERAARGGGT